MKNDTDPVTLEPSIYIYYRLYLILNYGEKGDNRCYIEIVYIIMTHILRDHVHVVHQR